MNVYVDILPPWPSQENENMEARAVEEEEMKAIQALLAQARALLEMNRYVYPYR